MTGQEAVNVAEAFAATIELTGVVLTKLDGDARGGAALSVKEVTGLPILFAGTGEKLEDFEAFHPDRMASRILGMGDVLTLIEKAEAVFDADEAAKTEEKLRKGHFTLEDFLEQMRQMRKMGPLSNVVGMMPGVPKEMRDAPIDEGELGRRRGDHLLDDPRRAPRPDDDQRIAAAAHRGGERDVTAAGQRAAQAVQDGAEDDAVPHEAREGQAGEGRRSPGCPVGSRACPAGEPVRTDRFAACRWPLAGACFSAGGLGSLR